MSKQYYEFKPLNVGRWIVWSLFALVLVFATKLLFTEICGGEHWV